MLKLSQYRQFLFHRAVSYFGIHILYRYLCFDHLLTLSNGFIEMIMKALMIIAAFNSQYEMNL